MRWDAHVDGDGASFVGGAVLVWDLYFVIWDRKQSSAVHEGDFVASPGFFLLGGAGHRKARDAVEGCCAEIE